MELPLTPLDFLTRARRLFPDRVGVIDGDASWTYREFATRCDQQARLLRDLGVQPGDVVAWLCGNTHELLEAYYGVLLAGAVLLPLNIRLSGAELRSILEQADARVLFRHPDQPDPGGSVAQVVLDDHFEAALARQGTDPLEPPTVDEHAAAEIFFTSGSTGMPKGAVLTHRSLYLHAVHNALTNSITGDDVIIHLVPLFHVNGWGTPHYLTGLGGTHVMLPRFDAGTVLRLIETHGVTRIFGVPAMIRMLLDHPDMGSTDCGPVVATSIGGAPVTPEMLAEVEAAFDCTAICGYGMTEASPTLTRSLDKPGEPPSTERRATTGLPIVGVDARVLGPGDVEVPWDGASIGEVCARSNHVMDRYLDAPEATAEVLRDGWLRTGDLAVVRPDGYLVLVDRKKDLIISGGENIASPEVEHALTTHPAVREAAVVGRPDEQWGEVPVGWVSLHAGMSTDEAELIAHVRGRLAAFKAPKAVTIVDELPKGGTGKIDKTTLRAM
ncbi:AMP-binding protein [Actinospongicola halichondriae]|uniref:AMP-binding protein n=1 Tax=Actinospongicola halichondriae TaxID=3236844 RepID=UPI003D58A9AE